MRFTPLSTFLLLLALVPALPIRARAQAQSSVQGQNVFNKGNVAHAAEQQIESVIVSLERKLWESDVLGDSALNHELIAPDFEGIKHGLRFSLQDDAATAKEYKLRSYTMSDERIRLIRPDAVLLTYRAKWTGTFAGTELPDRPFYIASIWVNQAGHWRNIFYAETQPDFATEAYQRLTKGVSKGAVDGREPQERRSAGCADPGAAGPD